MTAVVATSAGYVAAAGSASAVVDVYDSATVFLRLLLLLLLSGRDYRS